MSTKVESYINMILMKEGDKYTDDPSDSGCKTRWGITENVARAYGYTGSMKSLPRSTAFAIYLKRYWTNPKFDRVELLSPDLSERLMDFGVLAGPSSAVIHLQRALNSLNQNEKYYPDLKVDGVIGNITLYALSNYLKIRRKEGEVLLIGMVAALQSVFLLELSESRPKDEKWQYGWQLNRAIGPLLNLGAKL